MADTAEVSKNCPKSECGEDIVVDLPCGPQICIPTKACEDAVAAVEAPAAEEKTALKAEE